MKFTSNRLLEVGVLGNEMDYDILEIAVSFAASERADDMLVLFEKGHAKRGYRCDIRFILDPGNVQDGPVQYIQPESELTPPRICDWVLF